VEERQNREREEKKLIRERISRGVVFDFDGSWQMYQRVMANA